MQEKQIRGRYFSSSFTLCADPLLHIYVIWNRHHRRGIPAYQRRTRINLTGSFMKWNSHLKWHNSKQFLKTFRIPTTRYVCIIKPLNCCKSHELAGSTMQVYVKKLSIWLRVHSFSHLCCNNQITVTIKFYKFTFSYWKLQNEFYFWNKKGLFWYYPMITILPLYYFKATKCFWTALGTILI